jgi:hypothetical protein
MKRRRMVDAAVQVDMPTECRKCQQDAMLLRADRANIMLGHVGTQLSEHEMQVGWG